MSDRALDRAAESWGAAGIMRGEPTYRVSLVIHSGKCLASRIRQGDFEGVRCQCEKCREGA